MNISTENVMICYQGKRKNQSGWLMTNSDHSLADKQSQPQAPTLHHSLLSPQRQIQISRVTLTSLLFCFSSSLLLFPSLSPPPHLFSPPSSVPSSSTLSYFPVPFLDQFTRNRKPPRFQVSFFSWTSPWISPTISLSSGRVSCCPYRPSKPSPPRRSRSADTKIPED